jgi:ribosome-binding factor A
MKSFVRKSSDIKRRQRESAILRGLSPVLQNIFIDSEAMQSFFVSRVELSSDGGLCNVIIASSTNDIDVIKAGMREIKLFAPSSRAALAKILNGRYVPELLFIFDKQMDKQRQLNLVLSKISNEIRSEEAVEENIDEEETKDSE